MNYFEYFYFIFYFKIEKIYRLLFELKYFMLKYKRNKISNIRSACLLPWATNSICQQNTDLSALTSKFEEEENEHIPMEKI